MRRKIITDIRELRRKSDKIRLNEAKSIIKDLEDSLDLNKGIGLTAVQIGIPKAVAIIRMKKIKTNLINPKIIDKTDKVRFKGEKCLSLPGITIDTTRYLDIIIENDDKQYSVQGLEAVVIQHEIDHMNGLTILDRKWRKK